MPPAAQRGTRSVKFFGGSQLSQWFQHSITLNFSIFSNKCFPAHSYQKNCQSKLSTLEEPPWVNTLQLFLFLAFLLFLHECGSNRITRQLLLRNGIILLGGLAVQEGSIRKGVFSLTRSFDHSFHSLFNFLIIQLIIARECKPIIKVFSGLIRNDWNNLLLHVKFTCKRWISASKYCRVPLKFNF